MRTRALRVLQDAARRAQTRTHSARAVRLARTWQYPNGAARLVPAPVFLLSSMRSGSTGLRRMLDNHSRICAPQEMHLSMWRVETDSSNAKAALEAIGLSADELANLLWDRVLHLQLVQAQKSIIVDKTPRNTLLWKRIAQVWPDARFLILLRHPARVAESLQSAHPGVAAETHYAHIERYALALHDAMRGAGTALTVRYEDLIANPDATTQRIAQWLGVPWESEMTAVRPGDANARQDLPWRREPDARDIPVGLQRSCELLGYV